jgi:hypothetical protein
MRAVGSTLCQSCMSAAEPERRELASQQRPQVKSASELLTEFIENSKNSAFQPPQSQGHTSMLDEQPDPQWSPVASGQLRDYLAQQLGTRF